jgi:autotransporter-associated beta strand protein
MWRIHLRRVPRAFGLAVTLALATTPAALAQTFAWDGGLSHGNFTIGNLWSIPNNWVGGVAPVSGAATNLVFAQSGMWTTADQNIANPFLLNTLSFNGANNFTALSDEPLQFNFSNGSSPFIAQNTANSITVGNAIATTSSGLSIGGVAAGSLTLSGNVTGPGALIFEASGTTVLTGNNSYSGQTIFELGVTQAGNSGALGTGTLSFSGGTLQYGPGNNTDYSARFVANQSYVIDTNSQTVTFGSVLQGGSGLLKKLGAGTLMLSNAANTYAGGTILDDGILAVATDSALGASSGGVTFAGGTLEATASFTSARGLTFNGAGGGVSVDSGKTLTLSGALTGPGLLAKVGFGTLILNGSPSIGGGYQVVRGTLDFLAATVSVGFGTLAAGAGATIQYDAGTTIVGGFLHGPGAHVVTGGAVLNGSTTFNSTVVNATGAGSFINFTNGGSFNVTAGASTPVAFSQFTNGGSGSITIGAVSAVTAVDFQSYGTLTLTPAVVGSGQDTLLTNTGTSPMYFNGGSRTFLGTPTTAGPPSAPNFVAGIDLHGQNAVVAGGLFVNNGFVVDSTNNGAGTGTIVADFGALVKGAGFFQNSVITQNGGRVQAGNSPGSASFGSFVFGPGGVNNYVFAIDDATGTAGPGPDALGHVSGWGLISAVKQSIGSTTASGDFTWTATPAAKLTVAIDTLVNPTTVGTDVVGPMADFDPSHAYSWPAARWAGTYSGPTDAATLNADTAFDTSGFVNSIAGTFGWSLDSADQTLSLTYTPTAVPEPGAFVLTGMATIGWVTLWRKRLQSNGPAATLSA